MRCSCHPDHHPSGFRVVPGSGSRSRCGGRRTRQPGTRDGHGHLRREHRHRPGRRASRSGTLSVSAFTIGIVTGGVLGGVVISTLGTTCVAPAATGPAVLTLARGVTTRGCEHSPVQAVNTSASILEAGCPDSATAGRSRPSCCLWSGEGSSPRPSTSPVGGRRFRSTEAHETPTVRPCCRARAERLRNWRGRTRQSWLCPSTSTASILASGTARTPWPCPSCPAPTSATTAPVRSSSRPASRWGRRGRGRGRLQQRGDRPAHGSGRAGMRRLPEVPQLDGVARHGRQGRLPDGHRLSV